jgi:hypothetical protein
MPRTIAPLFPHAMPEKHKAKCSETLRAEEFLSDTISTFACIFELQTR